MQIKNYIIAGIICFIIGCLLTGGISLYIFFRVGTDYEKDIAERDSVIERIREDLAAANNTIAEITEIRTGLEKSNSEAITIVVKLRECQSEFRQGLESGTEKK